jgi:glycosyltransferase involved in cell wall biosynthesis
MTSMRIGIDARFYGEAGPGRYAKSIVEHLEVVDKKNEYFVYLRPKGFDAYTPGNQNFKKVAADYKWYSWGEQIGFLILILKGKLDLFYVPHFNIPVLYPGKLVTAIPDIIMHTYSTERGTTLFKPYFIFKKAVYRFVVWWAVTRSIKVIVPSNDVISDFNKVFPSVDSDKYVLAYEGFDPTFGKARGDHEEILKKYGIRKPYLLYISSMYEHKNVHRLIDSFKKLMSKYNYEGQLVLVGKVDKYSQDISGRIKKEGLSDRVIMPGMINYISDDETVTLRKNADVYVFPSLKEGFSLTPLEAQYFELPCVISDIPCHREIYRDSVMYFNPENADDMAEKISRVIKDPTLRDLLKTKGLANIDNYSWESAAQITLRVFDDILKNI